MKRLILSSGMTLLIFTGCNTYQKQLRRTREFLEAHKDVAAQFCADNYGVDTLRIVKGDTVVRLDTVTIKTDSVPCPPAEKGKTVYVKCPDQKYITRTVSKTDTVYLRDNAAVSVSNAKYVVVRDSLTIYKEKLRVSEEKNKNKTKTIWILGGFIALVGLGTVLKLTGRI